jgi:hypothetical protein
VLRQSSPKSPDQPALLGGAQGMKNKKTKTEKSGGQQVAHQTKLLRRQNEKRQVQLSDKLLPDSTGSYVPEGDINTVLERFDQARDALDKLLL